MKTKLVHTLLQIGGILQTQYGQVEGNKIYCRLNLAEGWYAPRLPNFLIFVYY